ncbi:MAG: hypothetical protein K6F93_00225 [Lachnospiraceae bacterium]|nr:hypothetical protein [Lachnospiraceae bacterium]
MNSTEIEIRRQNNAAAVSRNYDSVLHLIYALVSLAFVGYLAYFVTNGLVSSDFSDTELARSLHKANQDSDSIFLSLFLLTPFVIWRLLKSIDALVLYFSGRKAAKNGTVIKSTGISLLKSFSSGEGITLVAVLALGGFYTILMSYSFYAAVDKKTKENLYGPIESYLPFVIFVICMVLAIIAVFYIKSSSQTMSLILQNKDTYKKISPVPAYISFVVAVLPIIIAFIFNPSYNNITSNIVAGNDRLITLINMVYSDGFFTFPFIILLVLFAAKFVFSGLVYLKASKAGVSDSSKESLSDAA